MIPARSMRFAIGVCGHMPKRHVIEIAADLARAMSAQMTALMIEDGASESLGSIPFAREFMIGRGGWSEVGAMDIISRRESSRRRARIVFGEIATTAGIEVTVKTLTGSAVAEIANAISAFDVVALPAPEIAGEWMMLPYSSLAEAALHGKSAAVIVPSRTVRRSGPIAALIGSADDKALEIAGRLALVADEKLVVLATGIDDVARSIEHIAKQAGIPIHRLRLLDVDGAGQDVVVRTLASIGERTIILGRKFFPDAGIDRISRLAAARCVPVILAGEE
jgi:hypothetical protein